MSVRAAFHEQGKACAALGSPFMGRLMPLIGDRLATGRVAERVLGWQGDPSPGADSVPLRLAGSLHALRIGGLAFQDAYPPITIDDDTLWTAIRRAMEDHEGHILKWLERPPQTNEVRRAAPLRAALAIVAKHYGAPVELMELGCSGGLNLRADQFALLTVAGSNGPESSPVTLAPTWKGDLPDIQLPPVVARRGVDLSPIDPATDEGRLRLLAFLWPDQPERIAMTDAAIAIARQVPARIAAGDAGAWLEKQLAKPLLNRTRVVYHTVAWQYFPDATKARALRAMERTKSPLVRFAMEADGGQGARLTLTHYPSGEIQELGRADFHGRWVDWRA